MEKRSSLKSAALFIAFAMIIQFVAVVFLTPAGLSAIYPLAAAFSSETVVPDYSFNEYYDLKTRFEGSDTFFLGADTTVADSYTVILDLFRFLNRSFGVDTLVLNVGRSTAARINDCVSAKDDSELAEKIDALRSAGLFPEELINFVRRLYAFRQTMPQSETIRVAGAYVETVSKATVDKVHSALIARWGNVPDEVSEVLSIVDTDEFFGHLCANEAAFREFFGDEETDLYLSICEHYRAGDYKEWRLWDQISELMPARALIVTDRGAVSEESPLRAYVSESGAKAKYLSVNYVSCTGLVKGTEEKIHDFGLPFAPSRGIFIVTEDGISGFDRWYRFVCDPSGGAGARICATADRFIVVGSPAVKYGEGNR